VHTKFDAIQNSREQAGYVEVSGGHLYTVLHGPANPVARVLLVGPFAPERHYSYIPWVQWARFLATKQIEILRYDYRGVGESSGVFGDMTFDNWCEDVAVLANWLKARSPEVRLVLHGLELGALLASKSFAEGIGDALLTWAAPPNANEVLRAALLRRIAIDHIFNGAVERKTFSDYVQQLDTEIIEVEGYQLSRKLWQDSLKFETPLATGESSANWACGRPVRLVPLDKRAAPLVKGSTMGYMSVNPDLSELFADNFEWIATVFAI
jgi:hypothetical protein